MRSLLLSLLLSLMIPKHIVEKSKLRCHGGRQRGEENRIGDRKPHFNSAVQSLVADTL